VNILANTGTREFTASVISIIVGLHFIPLAKWLPARLYYASAALLVGTGTAGLWIRGEGPRVFYVSVVAASILWLTSVVVLRSQPPGLTLASDPSEHWTKIEGA
jgi:hypothetical protein